MDGIRPRIAQLEQEIRQFTILLPVLANDDARHWTAACLNDCVQEYIQVVEQYYAARIAAEEHTLATSDRGT